MAKIEDRVRRVRSGDRTDRDRRRRRFGGVHQPIDRPRRVDRLHARGLPARRPPRRRHRRAIELAAPLDAGERRACRAVRHRHADASTGTAGRRSRPRSPGSSTRPTDPAWNLGRALMAAAPHDPDVLRGAMSVAGVLARGDRGHRSAGHDGRPSLASAPVPPLPGPSRAELVEIVEQRRGRWRDALRGERDRARGRTTRAAARRCSCSTAGPTPIGCGATRSPRSPPPGTAASFPTCAASASPTVRPRSRRTRSRSSPATCSACSTNSGSSGLTSSVTTGARRWRGCSPRSPPTVSTTSSPCRSATSRLVPRRRLGSSARSRGTCCCSSSKASPSSWLSNDDFANLRAWSAPSRLDAVIADLAATGRARRRASTGTGRTSRRAALVEAGDRAAAGRRADDGDLEQRRLRLDWRRR